MADRGRRWFGPVVLTGLAAAGLCALAGSRGWATFDEAAAPGRDSEAYVSVLRVTMPAPEAPLVTALALVVLACWGVLLVTRGRFRRAVALLAAVTSVSMVVAAAAAFGTTAGDLAESFDDLGVDGSAGRTVWAYLGLAAALVSAAATAAAVRLTPGWPEMGARYDAPGSEPSPHEETGLDLWRAMDEGRDPTVTPTVTERKQADP